MSLIIAKWTVEEYHRMIEVGILSDRQEFSSKIDT
ncbi:hypothetical protein NSTC745_02261 [Nostoc sp. DSM 114161]